MNLKKTSEKAFGISKKGNQYKNDGQDTLRALKHCAGEVIEATEAYTRFIPQGRRIVYLMNLLIL